MANPPDDAPITVTQQGEWYPHRLLWFVVLENLRNLVDQNQNHMPSVGTAALLVTHSCFEGYLNFAGEHLYGEKAWSDFSRIPVMAKLTVISDKLGVQIDRSRRPYATVKKLNTWRNRVVHPQIERHGPVDVDVTDVDQLTRLQSKFLDQVDGAFLRRSTEDVEELCDALQTAANKVDPRNFPGPAAFRGIYGQSGHSMRSFRKPDEQ